MDVAVAGPAASTERVEGPGDYFPAPPGFEKDYEALMAELEAVEAVEDTTMDEDAQTVAYERAVRQHREALSPPPARHSALPGLEESSEVNPSPPTSQRSSSPTPSSSLHPQGRHVATTGIEARDDILDFLAPEFSQRREDMKKSGRERPLFFAPPGLSGGGPRPPSLTGSTSTSTSLLGPGGSTARGGPNAGSDTLRPRSIMSQTSSQEKRTSGFFSAMRDGLKSPALGSTKSFSANLAAQASPSRSSSTLRRSSSVSSSVSGTPGSTISSRARPKTAPRTTPLDKEVANTPLIAYGSGRRRGSQTSTGSDGAEITSSPSNETIASGASGSLGRKSSLRRPATFDSAAKGFAKSRRVSAIFNLDQSKTLYSVRFANAHSGLGLRSVAEDEAERGGSETKWIGTGRGRYSDSMQQGQASDEMYVKQMLFMSPGGKTGADYSRVREYFSAANLAQVGRRLNLDKVLVVGNGTTTISNNMVATALNALFGAVEMSQGQEALAEVLKALQIQ
ncbi:hypothetical protein RQP46_009134 [Phenoliferia psychrophenolica]